MIPLSQSDTAFALPMNRSSTGRFFREGARKTPPGFGLRQSSGAFGTAGRIKSGRGLPHSKTLARTTSVHGPNACQNEIEAADESERIELGARPSRLHRSASRRSERFGASPRVFGETLNTAGGTPALPADLSVPGRLARTCSVNGAIGLTVRPIETSHCLIYEPKSGSRN